MVIAVALKLVRQWLSRRAAMDIGFCDFVIEAMEIDKARTQLNGIASPH